MEGQDLEQQPLLQPETHYESTAPQTEQNVKKHKRSYKKALASIIILVVFHVVLIAWVVRYIPSQDLIQSYYTEATQIEIRHFAFDGWLSDDGESHLLADDSPKYLKFRAQVSVRFDHDQVQKADDGAIARKQRTVRLLSQSVMKAVCFDINNMMAYNDNETTSQTLGSIRIPATTCVDMRQGIVSELDIPILVEPDAKNIASVIMKIWRGKFDELKLWSSLDVTMSKQLKNNWGLPVWKTRIDRLDWRTFIDWKRLNSYLKSLQAELRKPVEVGNLEIRDNKEALDFRIPVSYTVPRQIKTLMTFPEKAIIPSISWKVQLPGCDTSEFIVLENALFRTPSIPIDSLLSEDKIGLEITGDIQGPLPDELLYHVCSSDEENVVTPMNLFLNKIFNSTELLRIGVQGYEALDSPNNAIPIDFLHEFLPYMQEDLEANLTLNASQLVEHVSMDGLKLKWTKKGWDDRELTLLGKVIALVNLPYYNFTNSGGKETVSIKKIKGLTRLFHNDVHFINVPMDVWLDAKSKLLHDEESGANQLEVTFDIANQDVDVVNSIELTRCLNEILLRGEAEVYVQGKLDLMTETKLGAIVLLGLEGDGTTTVKK